MERNRRGLALMVAALLISLLVASLRSCNEGMSHKFSSMDSANQALVKRAHSLTRPIDDYTIRSIDEGVMTVDAGPSLSEPDLKVLAARLTAALRDADAKELGSEMVFVEIYRRGALVCKAQTSFRGIWIEAGSGGSGEYVNPQQR